MRKYTKCYPYSYFNLRLEKEENIQREKENEKEKVLDEINTGKNLFSNQI